MQATGTRLQKQPGSGQPASDLQNLLNITEINEEMESQQSQHSQPKSQVKSSSKIVIYPMQELSDKQAKKANKRPNLSSQQHFNDF